MKTHDIEAKLDPQVEITERESLLGTDLYSVIEQQLTASVNEQAKKKEVVDKIQELWKSQFDVSDPTAKDMVNSTMIFEAIWRVSTTTKLPNVNITVAGLQDDENAVVAKVIQYAIEESGLIEAHLYAKFYKMLFGDAFIETYIRGGKGLPTAVRTINIDEVLIDSFCNRLNTRIESEQADFVMFRNTMSVQRHREKYGFDCPVGKVPLGIPEENLDRYSAEQASINQNSIEIVTVRNRTADFEIELHGSQAIVGKFKRGLDKDKRGKPNLRVHQLVCFESLEGCYSYGLGELLYKMHKIFGMIVNDALAHARRMANPLWLLRMENEGSLTDFNREVQKAVAANLAGGMGIIKIKDKSGNYSNVQVKELISDSGNAVANFQFVRNELEKKLINLGIDMANVERTGVTAREIQYNERSASLFNQFIMQNDVYEIELLVNQFVLDIQQHVSENDTTVIPVKFQDASLEVQIGDVARILKGRKFDVDVDIESGSYPDKTLQRNMTMQQIEILSKLSPNSPALYEAISDLTAQNGRRFSPADLQPQNGGVSAQAQAVQQ